MSSSGVDVTSHLAPVCRSYSARTWFGVTTKDCTLRALPYDASGCRSVATTNLPTLRRVRENANILRRGGRFGETAGTVQRQSYSLPHGAEPNLALAAVDDVGVLPLGVEPADQLQAGRRVHPHVEVGPRDHVGDPQPAHALAHVPAHLQLELGRNQRTVPDSSARRSSSIWASSTLRPTAETTTSAPVLA
ncbi:hypothetical protein VTK73DRAFT_3846 [Phialemonium thermophilum]|uniref:Uncharacterized protein n=1 Tax=Phialemonium thermophilum TaxID=223376 RepID=A0ABR3VEZ9_9PEZI